MAYYQVPVQFRLISGLGNTDDAMDMAALAMRAPLEQVLCSGFNRQQIAAVLWLVCDQLEQYARDTEQMSEADLTLLEIPWGETDPRIYRRQKAMEILEQRDSECAHD